MAKPGRTGLKRKKPQPPPRPLGSFRSRPGERTLEQRREDVEWTATLFLKGWSCADIAREMNSKRERQISVNTVITDLRRVHAIWAEQIGDSLASCRNRVLAELQAVRKAAWEGYEASKKASETSRRMVRPPKPPGPKPEGYKPPEAKDFEVQRIDVKTQELVPDVQFLDRILEANKRECEILGITHELHFHAPEPKKAEEEPVISEDRMAEYLRKKNDLASKIVEADIVTTHGNGNPEGPKQIAAP